MGQGVSKQPSWDEGDEQAATTGSNRRTLIGQLQRSDLCAAAEAGVAGVLCMVARQGRMLQ